MSQEQISYILLSIIGFLSFVGIGAIICSIIFDNEVSNYKFTPPSCDKRLSFDTDEDLPLSDLIDSDLVVGDFDE